MLLCGFIIKELTNINFESKNLITKSLFFLEYNSLLAFLIASVVISFILYLGTLVFSPSVEGVEKLSAYECGFEPFEDARNVFDIKFYLIAILFVIFDVELSFLFPWALSLQYVGDLGFWIVIDFLIELIIGYIYIWKRGAFIFI